MATAEVEILPARERLRASLKNWLPWAGKASLAILDQGLISGSNFLIGVLLARWLEPEAYGAYALGFAIFLLLSLAYQALLLEPLSVFGPSTYRYAQREYLGALVWTHMGLILPIASILALVAWAAHLFASSSTLTGAVAGLTLAGPCVLLFWLARGAFYVKLAPLEAVKGAVLYCGIVLGGVWLLFQRGLLSPFSAFLLMGFGALGVGGLQLVRLRPALRPGSGDARLSVVCRRHWQYGRWALGSSCMIWIPWNVQYLLVGTGSGVAAAGELRALLNLTLPAVQGFVALALLAQPIASRLYVEKGVTGMGKLTCKVTLLFTAMAAAYWVPVSALSQPIVSVMYSGKYLSVAGLVPWVALASVLTVASYGPTLALRAMQKPASVFIVYGASSAIALGVGIPATRTVGVRGAVLSIVLSSLAAFALGFVMLRKKVHSALRH